MGDAVANTPNRSRLASILLARKPRFTDSTNDTTATARSKDGYTMAVSFWMADPPQLSLFSIHCSKPSRYTLSPEFSVWPKVVGADGPFVLLRAGFYAGAGSREYFMYKAADDGPPSLERIPSPNVLVYDHDDLREVREFGILGQGGDGHYLVLALRNAPSSSDDYQLRIYSSVRKSWTARTLQNPCPGVDRVIPEKVITLGQGGLLGWVDLSHGMLACDLLRLQDPDPTGGGGGGDDDVTFFIPMPEPLPGNRYKEKYPIPPAKKMRKHPLAQEPHRSVSWFRDLACVNGVLKFIEMENPAPPENKDNIVSDSDLIMWLKRKAVDRNSKTQLSAFRDAWRAVTWSQKVSPSSANYWRQTCAAHVADIKESEELVTFRDLYSAFPILSTADDCHDILYLKSLVEPRHQDGWVVTLDIGNKALKAIAQYYLPDYWYYDHRFDPEHPFRTCTLSSHMDITPGIQVSAFRQTKTKRKTTKASSSADQPSDTSPWSAFQRVFELEEKIRRERNPPESIIQNDHISSQVHPVVNNLPPQKCFNKPDGPYSPGYASLAPVHGCHNYQPPWPPSKQQLPSASAFGPHEAPPSRFNNFNGGSYPGYYSQQLSAPNSFAYGAYTGYGNYQQQWQQLAPTPELPIGASWQHPPPVQGQSTPREVKPVGYAPL